MSSAGRAKVRHSKGYIEEHSSGIYNGRNSDSEIGNIHTISGEEGTQSTGSWSIIGLFIGILSGLRRYIDGTRLLQRHSTLSISDMHDTADGLRIENEKNQRDESYKEKKDTGFSADDSLVILDVIGGEENVFRSFIDSAQMPSDGIDKGGTNGTTSQYGTSLRLCDDSKYHEYVTKENYRPEAIPITKRKSPNTDNVLSRIEFDTPKTESSYDSVIMKHYLPEEPVSRLNYSLMDSLLSNFHIDKISEFYQKERDRIQDIIVKEKEESQSKIQPLLKDELKQVTNIWRSQSNNIVVSNYQIDISVRDFKTLDDGRWLNDNVIDYYFNLITTSHSDVYGWTTHFFTTLQEKGYAGVARWAKRRKINVTQKILILIPINIMGTHWALAVVDNVNKTIKYYDSLVSGGNRAALETIRSYMVQEAKRLASNIDYQHYKLFPKVDAPQQKNGYDCGVFTCTSAKFVVNGDKLTYGQKDMKTIRRRMAYEILKNKLIK